MINLELFSCAGGMAEGFRRAGVHFDVAVDFAPDHCDNYEVARRDQAELQLEAG